MNYVASAAFEQYATEDPTNVPENPLAQLVLDAQDAVDPEIRANLIGQLYSQVAGYSIYAACQSGALPSDVEDVAATTVLKFTEQIDQHNLHPETDKSVLGFIKTTARNTTIGQFRHANILRMEPDDGLVETAGSDDTAAAALEGGWNAEALLAQVNLPGRQAEVIRMQILEEKTPAEVAEALGMTLSAVKSCVHRGITELRQELARTKETTGIADAEEAVLQLINAGPVPAEPKKTKPSSRARNLAQAS